MTDKEEPWSLVIGRVTAPFGTRGELRVRPETDLPERFQELEQVCLERPDGEPLITRVRSARVTPKGVLLAVAAASNRQQAEALRNAWVKIKPSMALPLPEGAYYLHQILGLHVFTDDGRDLGEVTEVISTAANDVYVTPKAMIPALRDVVREVDLEGGRMVVSLLPEDTASTEDDA
jgi:16S rRNA processing protein RimM